jgi:hypothetical protein
MATHAEHIFKALESRRFQRFRIDLPVRVVVPMQDKTKIVSGRGTDLNEGGLAVFAGTEMRVGDCIYIEFTPPYSGKPVRVAGQIRHRTGYKYGIEFITDTPDQQKAVNDFRMLLQFATGRNLF